MSGVSPTTMVCFRAGPLALDLDARAQKAGTRLPIGAVARRDLSRYYWLLRVALAGSPPLSEESLEDLLVRLRPVLAAGLPEGDLTPFVFVCADALPGWSAWALLALADALERAPRDPGGRLTAEAVGLAVEAATGLLDG